MSEAALVHADGASNAKTGHRFPWAGLALVLAVIVAELMLFTMRFDLVKKPYGQYLAWMPRNAGFAVRWLISLAFFAMTLGIRQFYKLFQQYNDQGLIKIRWRFLAMHVASMAVFYLATSYLYTDKAARFSPLAADGLIAVWAVAWGVAAYALARIVFPDIFLTRCLSDEPTLWLFSVMMATLTDQSAFRSRLAWKYWTYLTELTLNTVAFLIQLVHKNAIVKPEQAIVGNETFSVNIQPACSGAEGMGLIFMFLAIYFYYCRADLKFPRVLILLPIGLCLSWVLNVLRIFLLIEIGIFYSPETALGGFHSQFGWLMFNSIALGLILVSRTRYFRNKTADTQLPRETTDVVAYVGPFAALLASTMITQALAAGFDIFYPFRILAVGLVLWECRRHYKEPLFAFSWTAVIGGATVFVVWMAFERALASPELPVEPEKFTQSISSIPKWVAIVWIFLRAVGSVITVPIAEELVFRGYLLRRLQSADFVRVTPAQVTPLAILVSSAAFGALHSRWLAGLVSGGIYALIYLRKGRLGEAVTAHALTNLMIAVFAIATGAWSLWN